MSGEESTPPPVSTTNQEKQDRPVKDDPKKTTYRMEEQKVFEVNRKHRERR